VNDLGRERADWEAVAKLGRDVVERGERPAACPLCQGPPGPTPGSDCPGCWTRCRSRFGKLETAPCGEVADAPLLLYGMVRVCRRHYQLFMGLAEAHASELLDSMLGPAAPGSAGRDARWWRDWWGR